MPVSTAGEPQDYAAALAKIAHLEQALDSARLIGAAVGIVMVTQQLTYDAAFFTLAQVSQSHNRKLRDVADEIVLTGLAPQIRHSGREPAN